MESRAAPALKRSGLNLSGLAALVMTAAPLPAQQLQVDVPASRIYVVTHRTGLLSFLGHEHAILAQRWTAQLCWDAPSHVRSRATFAIDARTLEIDADSARAIARLGKGPAPQKRAQIQRQLHDDDHLATDRFPEMRFESSAVQSAGPGLLTLRGTLTIKGVSREVEIPVTVEPRADGASWLAATTSFRQSSFGVRPESIAGVVKVADVVDLHVGLLVRQIPDGC